MRKNKTLQDHASELADRVSPHVAAAREKAGPMLADAVDRAGPALADARDKAGPVVADARTRFVNDVVPAVSAALVAAGDATADVRGETKRRGKAAAAAVRGDAPKNSHKLRTLLLIAGLGGVIAWVAKRMADRPATTQWQSSYTPPPASTGAHKAPEPEPKATEAAAEPEAEADAEAAEGADAEEAAKPVE
ncbi:MAG: hypothetical protein ACRDPI_09665 [Nocardioidaceae bacterium]